jgi:integrase
MIVDHVQAYGTAPDGRLFQTYRGGIYSLSTLWRVLQEARQQVLTPAQLKSPLIHKPYDCRHGGVSWSLNAGVPAPLVAEWAGHTVEVLLRIYAHCIDGDGDRWFGPMEDALGRVERT